MRKVNVSVVVAMVFAVLAAALLLGVPHLIARPRLIMGRSLSALDPSLFPYLTLSTMLLISVWYAYKARRGEYLLRISHVSRGALGRSIVSLFVFLLYAILMEPIGFVPSSIFALGFLTTFYGNRSWTYGIALSMGFPFAIYFLFLNAFKIQLPQSTLW